MYSLKDLYSILKQQLQPCILSNLPYFFRTEVPARRYHSFEFNYQLWYLLGCRHAFIRSESVVWWRHLQSSIFSMVLLLFRGNVLSSPFCQRRCVYFQTPIAGIDYIRRTGFTSRTTAQKSKFSITEETLNGKLNFCAVKIWRVLRLFEESNCSPYFFKVSFFSAELVAVIFSWRVLCYTAILPWWTCYFDQSKRAAIYCHGVALYLHVIVKLSRWDIFIMGI